MLSFSFFFRFISLKPLFQHWHTNLPTEARRTPPMRASVALLLHHIANVMFISTIMMMMIIIIIIIIIDVIIISNIIIIIIVIITVIMIRPTPHARLRGLAPAILCFKSHLCLVSICVCCYLLCLCFLETHNSNKQYWNEITKQGWPPHARLRGRAPAQLLFDSHVRALLQFCVCLSFLSNTSMKQPMLKLNIEALPTPHARISHFSPAPHCECCVF